MKSGRRTQPPPLPTTSPSMAQNISERGAAERDAKGRNLRKLRRHQRAMRRETSVHAAEPVVERVTRPAYGTDGVSHMATIDRLAQTTDMDVHSSFVNVDIGAPDPVEQLLP